MKIGFIGAGNMAGAIIRGICAKELVPAEDIYVSNPSVEKLEKLKKDCGVHIFTENVSVAQVADILFLCVKPQKLEEVAAEIKEELPEGDMIVSIAAGKTLEFLEKQFGKNRKIVRVMPNAPAMTGSGISAVAPNGKARKDSKMEDVLSLLKSIGEVETVEESMIDVAGQIAGASPAWISMIMEAMADGAVREGMSREQAYRFVAAAVAGTGALAKEQGGNPALIKDMVSSPKGTTIEGIKVLEEKGVRGAFLDAVAASCEKARNI